MLFRKKFFESAKIEGAGVASSDTIYEQQQLLSILRLCKVADVHTQNAQK